MRAARRILALVVGAWAAGVTANPTATATPTATRVAAAAAVGRWLEPQVVQGRCGGSDTGSARVVVYLPAGYTPARRWPLVVALHGWNHDAAHWRGLDLGALADRHGLVVVAPELGTSVYERAFYPETVQAWGPAPGACWVGEVVLPWARRSLAVDGRRGRTAVLGYSTGGRGALVVAARYPEFAFAGSLSGTYDLAALEEGAGEYLIHERVFGPRRAFAERWRAEEIPLDAPALATTRLWLAHGAQDPVVPVDQQDRLRARLGRTHRALQVVRVPRGAHGNELWRAQLGPLVEALARALAARPGGEARPPGAAPPRP